MLICKYLFILQFSIKFYKLHTKINHTKVSWFFFHVCLVLIGPPCLPPSPCPAAFVLTAKPPSSLLLPSCHKDYGALFGVYKKFPSYIWNRLQIQCSYDVEITELEPYEVRLQVFLLLIYIHTYTHTHITALFMHILLFLVSTLGHRTFFRCEE